MGGSVGGSVGGFVVTVLVGVRVLGDFVGEGEGILISVSNSFGFFKPPPLVNNLNHAVLSVASAFHFFARAALSVFRGVARKSTRFLSGARLSSPSTPATSSNNVKRLCFPTIVRRLRRRSC